MNAFGRRTAGAGHRQHGAVIGQQVDIACLAQAGAVAEDGIQGFGQVQGRHDVAHRSTPVVAQGRPDVQADRAVGMTVDIGPDGRLSLGQPRAHGLVRIADGHMGVIARHGTTFPV